MKRLLLALVVAAVVVGGAAAVERIRRTEQRPRPELQRLLDALVTDPGRAAPGATAYVTGPRGTWAGAAGLADVDAREPMRPDARMRLESVSKLWTAALLLRLEEHGLLELDDTVGELAPDLLPARAGGDAAAAAEPHERPRRQQRHQCRPEAGTSRRSTTLPCGPS